jgi:outer membrane protein assembly factor BamD
MKYGYNLRLASPIVALLLLVMTLQGCGLFSTRDDQETARELAEEGMEAFDDKDYKESIESFEKLRDWYPFSKYAVLAELKLGDAYYQRQEYEEAIFAYEEFENLHPKNEAVPYVVYQVGRCYYDRLQSIDRDQTMAREAARAFERLVASYPQSPFAKKARDHIRTCRKNLAEHEFYVGNFYLKTKHYKAALERFKTVIRDYPDLGVHYKAIQALARCQKEMDSLTVADEQLPGS